MALYFVESLEYDQGFLKILIVDPTLGLPESGMGELCEKWVRRRKAPTAPFFASFPPSHWEGGRGMGCTGKKILEFEKALGI